MLADSSPDSTVNVDDRPREEGKTAKRTQADKDKSRTECPDRGSVEVFRRVEEDDKGK